MDRKEVTDVERERERCRQRRIELGEREMQRRIALREEAQQLCYSLSVLHKRTDRIERLLRMAEDRRERRGQQVWPWISYVNRFGEMVGRPKNCSPVLSEQGKSGTILDPGDAGPSDEYVRGWQEALAAAREFGVDAVYDPSSE